jgi:outer membrane murein-binding lipoprotein Lpp
VDTLPGMTPRTLAAPLVACALLLAGCSSEDDQRQEAFCDQVPDLLSEITDDVNAVYSDPQSAPQVLDEAVDRLEAVDPPEAAADVWSDLVSSWRALADLLDEADLTDPSANADLAPRLQELQGDLVSSGEAVDEYGEATC